MTALAVNDAVITAAAGLTPVANTAMAAAGVDTIDPGQYRALLLLVSTNTAATPGMTLDDPNSASPSFPVAFNPDLQLNTSTTIRAYLLDYQTIARLKNVSTGLITLTWGAIGASGSSCTIYGIR